MAKTTWSPLSDIKAWQALLQLLHHGVIVAGIIYHEVSHLLLNLILLYHFKDNSAQSDTGVTSVDERQCDQSRFELLVSGHKVRAYTEQGQFVVRGPRIDRKMNFADCHGKNILDLLLRDVVMPKDHVSYGCLACLVQVSSGGVDGCQEVVQSS